MDVDIKLVQEKHRKEAALKRQIIKNMKQKERQERAYGKILLAVFPDIVHLTEEEVKAFLKEKLYFEGQ